MRVLLLKHCSNIRFVGKETNGGQTEIMVTIDLLKSAGHSVTVATIDKYHSDARVMGCSAVGWDQVEMGMVSNDYDVLFVFNGVFNCFGGIISNEALTSYRLLKEFKGPIIYAVTDTAIPIGDCAGWIRGAQAKGKYPELRAEDYTFNAKRIFCLTQTYDLEVLKKIWDSECNGFTQYAYFPFETTVFFRKGLATSICDNPTTDLIYFGNPRSGKRDKKFAQLYCNQPDLVVDIYGNWGDTHIKNLQKKGASHLPNFKGKCDMYELHHRINNAYAHCYISDKHNEGTIWTTRFYEAILNRTCLFIDKDNDPKMSRFIDPFFYVQSNAELAAKIKQLKDDPTFRVQKLTQQFSAMSTILNTIPSYHRILDFNLKRASEYGAGV
jgi:hypothetical protein